MSIITKEERAAWLEEYKTFRVRDYKVARLLNALEAAEALAEAAEKAVKALEEFPIALGETLKRAEAAEARAEKAEARMNAVLNTENIEIGVLASMLAERSILPCDENGDCPHTEPDTCTNCTNGDCWLAWARQEAQKRINSE